MDQRAFDGDLNILQLTDCHLYREPHRTLLGIDTQQSLDQVLEAVSRALPRPDAVIATGDLVHDGSEAGYQRLAESLSRFDAPVGTLPGNHDDPDTMEQVLPRHRIQNGGTLELGNWSLVLLNSHQAGREGGFLESGELERLDQLLAESNGYVLVFVHHHPLPIGCRWLDRIGLANGEALLDRVRSHANLRGVVWGHVHQEWESRLEQAQLLGTPSTCIQFAPGTERFALALEPPAWRLLRLHPDGSITSQVHHLQELPMGLAVDSSGY